jgi:hypothetical protein
MRPHPNVIRYRRYETEPLPVERWYWKMAGHVVTLATVAAVLWSVS